jgi:hypothetical protein
MPCYSPLQAWYGKLDQDDPVGTKRKMVFNHVYAEDPDSPVSLPCGQCIGCRLERSRQWAIRCMHEASLYENNCFITLTFNPESLAARDVPESLDVRDFQLFMKRLRKKFGSGIRFFHCGEYGENKGRPHYHACLFNFDFPDKELWRVANGNRLYISESLSELWPYGFSTIGDVTFESAAYVARYIMKKVTGDQADDHYTLGHDPDTGEVIYKKPEYTTMSRRPGIGKKWFDQFKDDVYPSDFITVNGKKCKPPKFYDRIMESTRPFEFDDIKEKRLIKLSARQADLTPDRLAVREKVQELKLEKLVRNHDKE